MAKFFTSAKIFVRNIVHFLLDELCTLHHHSRMFRVVPPTPTAKHVELIIQEEKKLWTFPKTSVRLMSSCQHFCMQSRQYLLTKPLGLTAVRSCRNILFRRYTYQNLNLPVAIEDDKNKGKDEQNSKQEQINDPKESDLQTMVQNTPIIVKKLEEPIDNDLLDNNLYNSTANVEIVADDAVNLSNENTNRLPLNLQNLINEVEIETQVFSELVNSNNATTDDSSESIKTIPIEVTPIRRTYKKLEMVARNKIPDIVKYSHKMNAHNNEDESNITVETAKELQILEVRGGNDFSNTPMIPDFTQRQFSKESGKSEQKLSLKEIQKLAKRMSAMVPTTTVSGLPVPQAKPIQIVKKPKPPEPSEIKSKIPVNKAYTVDAFTKSVFQPPKVDIEHNPVIVERKQRMEMIKKTLEQVSAVKLDTASEIQTMSNAMVKTQKIPTLLSLASRPRYDGEGAPPKSQGPKPLPFRAMKDTNKVLAKDPTKNYIDPKKTLTSEDIRKKFNAIPTPIDRPKTAPFLTFATGSPKPGVQRMSQQGLSTKSPSIKIALPKPDGSKIPNKDRSSIPLYNREKSSIPLYKRQKFGGISLTNQGPLKPSTKPGPDKKVSYDNMTRNMNTTPRNSWTYLLSHAPKKSTKVSTPDKFTNKRRLNSCTSGYDSDLSNDTESFEQETQKEDDYNMIEVKVKKNLPYLQSHRTDSSINLTGLVDRSIAQELRMREIDEKGDKSQEVVDNKDLEKPEECSLDDTTNPDEPLFDSVRGIYCNQILCPSSSDVLTRYMNYSSQTESEDFKTKIKSIPDDHEDHDCADKNKEKDKNKVTKLKTCIT